MNELLYKITALLHGLEGLRAAARSKNSRVIYCVTGRCGMGHHIRRSRKYLELAELRLWKLSDQLGRICIIL